MPLAEACSLLEDLLRNPLSSVSRETNDGEAPWTITDYLLAHVWSALTGEKHPALPKDISRTQSDPQRQAKVNAAKERAAQRQRLIEAGEIT
jgi:hypothetical protein